VSSRSEPREAVGDGVRDVAIEARSVALRVLWRAEPVTHGPGRGALALDSPLAACKLRA